MFKLTPWPKAIIWSFLTLAVAIVTILYYDYLIAISEAEKTDFDWLDPSKIFAILLAIFGALFVEQALTKAREQYTLPFLTFAIAAIFLVLSYPHNRHTHLPFDVNQKLETLYDSLIVDIDTSYSPTLTQLDVSQNIENQDKLVQRLITLGKRRKEIWEVERKQLLDAEYKRKHCPCRELGVPWLLIPALLISIVIRKSIYTIEAADIAQELEKSKGVILPPNTSLTDNASYSPKNKGVTQTPPPQIEDAARATWCKKFNCSHNELDQAVRRVGRNPQQVEAYLKQQRTQNNNNKKK